MKAKMDWRFAQLVAEQNARGIGCQVVERKPVRDPGCAKLSDWRAAAQELDHRVAQFADLTSRSCGFRWVRCDDLSRHLYVWHEDREYVTSWEPTEDGTVRIIASQLQAKVVQNAQVVPTVGSVEIAAGLGPHEILQTLRENVAGWTGSLPCQIWWTALYQFASAVAAEYGPSSRVGTAAVRVARIMTPSGPLEVPPCGRVTLQEHVEFSLLIKLGLAFAAEVPGQNAAAAQLRAWRAAFVDLQDAMLETHAINAPAVANLYVGTGLV